MTVISFKSPLARDGGITAHLALRRDGPLLVPLKYAPFISYPRFPLFSSGEERDTKLRIIKVLRQQKRIKVVTYKMLPM